MVYSNIWISAGSAAFVWFYYLLNDLNADYKVVSFLFFSTLLTYTYQRYEKISKKDRFHGPRINWMINHLSLVKLIMIIGIVGSLTFAFYLEILSILILIISGLISFLYAFKFNLSQKKTNLRDIPGIKIYLISLVWAISCTLVPFIESGVSNQYIWLTTIGFFLYILGITIPFDIRDIELDDHSKKTIPQIFGINTAKSIAAFVLIGSYFFLSYPNFFDYKLLAGISLSIILVLFAKKEHGELYFSFLVDGLLIIVPVIYYLLQILYPTDI